MYMHETEVWDKIIASNRFRDYDWTIKARPLSLIGRGDDTGQNPHRAQISQFEVFELKFLNSSFSSVSSC